MCVGGGTLSLPFWLAEKGEEGGDCSDCCRRDGGFWWLWLVGDGGVGLVGVAVGMGS